MVQSSPVQSSPVQSSPVQSSPVQSSPLKRFCRRPSFQAEKRKFLTAGALLAVLPFFRPFSLFRRKKPYIFLAEMSALSWEQKEHYQNGAGLQILNDSMRREKRLLKIHVRRRADKVCFFYVFDSEKSFWKWGERIRKNNLFLGEKLPAFAQYRDNLLEGEWRRRLADTLPVVGADRAKV